MRIDNILNLVDEELTLWEYCPWCGTRFGQEQDNCSECQKVRFSSKKIIKKPPWRKILYDRQPYDDNYFDDELFLQGLRRNTNIKEYVYFDVVKDSAIITGQVTTITLFCETVEYVYSGRLSLPWVFGLLVFLTLIGFAIRHGIEKEWTKRKILADIKSLILLFSCVWMLSPVLWTLTEPFSNDTILALSIALFLVHLFTQDYSYMSGLSDRYTAPFSLNAAIFGSALLVSRLPSVSHVFAVISVAIELFALLPIIRHSLKVYSPKVTLFVTWGSVPIVALSLVPVSTAITYIYLVTCLFVTFVCPYWLTRIQRYKNTIHGPWDEAVPTRNETLWKA